MIVMGLTGSIGMGKSTAAAMCARLGCGVHNSDHAVHKGLAPDGLAFEEVAVTFPEAWDKRKRIIKRDVLGDIIFKDADKRRELEDILHPLVRADQKKFIAQQQALGRAMCVLDIPLLFETGAQDRVDYTICVTAPFHIQRRRVLARPRMDEKKFLAILSHQMPDRQKRLLADYVVQTGMGYAWTFRQLKDILREIKNKGARA